MAEPSIAFLVDGDNAEADLLDSMLAEAAKHGRVTVRRIYGDWTLPAMNQWKPVLHHHAIQPIQQFRNTIGKNATDSAMIIDAMDILHSGKVESFCIVSSDSDYTRLATRIREAGHFVLGIGRSKTPSAFVQACDLFVVTENLESDQPRKAARTEVRHPPGRREPRREHAPPRERVKEIAREQRSGDEEVDRPNDPLPLLRKAFGVVQFEDGWATLGAMGQALQRLSPGFDPRTYGHRQLLKLIQEYPEDFECKIENPEGRSTVHIRLKR